MGQSLINLGDILAYHARIRPRAAALTAGGGRFDFECLNRRVNRLANALSRVGIRRGDRVAIRLAGSHRHFESLFACATLGAIMVPINPRALPEELHHIVEQTTPGILFDSEAVYDEVLADASESATPSVGATGDSLLIMYTSGTTGPPKGVVLTQSNIIYSCFNQILGWQLAARDRVLVVAPLHHVGGLLALGLPGLYAGGTMHLELPEPAAIVEAIDHEQITALFLPPTLWVQLARSAALERADLSAVRLCASGGDPVPVPVLKHLIARFQAEFTDAYGLTEAASAVTILHGDEIVRRAGSAGKALAHNLIRILDAAGRALPAGEAGEIAVAGPTVMKEYWRNPDATAAALRDGWLRTGDRGHVDKEGFLYVAGRAAEVMTSEGVRIYPSEIERVVRAHPAVAEAAAVQIVDAERGSVIAVAVVPQSGTAPVAREILDFCVGKLPATKQPQAAFIFDSLPRNGSGKVVISELRTRCESGRAGMKPA